MSTATQAPTSMTDAAQTDSQPAFDGDYAGLFRLDGRSFVVLGAGAGIGEQVSQAIVALGGRVLCVDIASDLVEAVADSLQMPWRVADASTVEGTETVIAAARENLGSIDGFVDVIGRMHQSPVSGYDLETWEADFAVNLRHALLAGSHMAPLVENGSIVFISSVSGNRGSRFAPGYGPAKAALESWVKVLAAEHGPRGVRVNAVAPGLFMSPRMSASKRPEAENRVLREQSMLGRLGNPHEVASAIAFLLTPAAGNITANILPVDGGALSQESTGLDQLLN